VPPGKAKESADYKKLNPNGLIPTIDDDGFVLWESNAIVRYLAAKHANGTIFPADLRVRADADRWMDWQATVLAPPVSTVLLQVVRTAPEKRDAAVLAAACQTCREKAGVLDEALAGRSYLAGQAFTMADIAVGQWMWRYANLVPDRPKHANLEAWYQRLQERPAYRKVVMNPLE
jgi:glutathione S-transferase